MTALDQWINSSGADGLRNSMQFFLSDGVQTSFEFNFAGGYIDPADVKAYIYRSASGLTDDIIPVLTGPNTVKVTPAIPAGDYLVLYRDTQKTQPLVDFSNGAVMDEDNLGKIAKQAVFAAAEMVDRFSEIKTSSDDAIVRSYTALTTANEAKAQSATAESKANSAVNTAGAANSAAQAAVGTANAAHDIASGIDDKATWALENSAYAVDTAGAATSTANSAKSIAEGIDGKAQSALDNSATAVNTAGAAASTANQAKSTAEGVDTKAQQALDAVRDSNLPWLARPIGETVALRDDIPGVSVPPQGNPLFRYIKLTANDTYNAGVLINEVVSGSAPTITATAQVNLPGSPMHGQTLYLENTMGTFTRASVSSGLLQNSVNAAHTHAYEDAQKFGGQSGGTGSVLGVTDKVTPGFIYNTQSSGGTEARPRNIGKTLYMRVL